MEKHIFIKTLCTLLAVMLVNAAFAQEMRSYEFGHDRDGVNITNQTRGGVTISYSMSKIDFASFDYKGEAMHSIGINGITLPNEEGLPNVPNINRFIAVPQGAEAVLRVKSYEQTLIKDVNIEPSLGIQAETEEPNTEYVKDAKVYSEDKFYPEEFVSLSNQTSLRGVDIVAIEFSPVRYNPVTKEAIIYHDIEVEIEFEGGNGHFGDDRLRSPYWDPILKQNIMNYNSLPVIDYESRMQSWLNNRSSGYEYVIVIPNNDDWAEAANSLKEYRLSQGIITTVMRLDEMGVSNTTEMKTWFHNAYNSWEIAPVAFLLFGDHNTDMTRGIPAETVNHPSNSSCISDNRYADVTGDLLPDMVFSRLVAANGAEANMMASKQIEYEYTNPNMDESTYDSPVAVLCWQTERWFQLCSEIVFGYFDSKGKNPQRIYRTWQDTPGSSWSSADNTSTVVNYFGPSGRNYIPSNPRDLGGWEYWNGGEPEHIVDAINDGTMLVQQRYHGNVDTWVIPAFTSDHIRQLTNVGKMPFVMSINCLTGAFDETRECFAETFMRHTYNGENAGAVGILCSTSTSYSFVNDAFLWGVYDQFQPDFMPDYGSESGEGNWHPAFGNVAGKYFLAQSSWPNNTEYKNITYQIFTAHCDAFLRLYSEVPQEIEATYPEVVYAGTTSIQVTAPEGTTVAISKETDEGTMLLGVATATGESQDITIPAQIPSTTLKIVITGQNYLRFVDEIEVITGPNVVFNSYNLKSGQFNYGQTVNVTITLKNVGNEAANNVNVVLTSSSEIINITSGTATVTTIAAGATHEIGDYFAFAVADNIPDDTQIGFTLTCTSGDDTWTSNFSIVAHAPEMQFNSIMVQAGNNWYSTYITIDGTEGLDLIKSGLAASATMVKSQTSYTQYTEGYGWFGSLTTANNEEMYVINVAENHELCLYGYVADPTEHPITLHQNWNWIGYPVNGNLAVGTALNGASFSNNDVVKSQNSYSTYYEGYGWFGGLNTMMPGNGYMIYQAADTTQNLVYPSARDSKALKANVTAQDNHWVPNVNKFATNMNVTASISIDGEIQRNESLEVAAFCNGEVRGSARPMYFEPLDEYVAMLTVYGNQGDNLTFKLFDTETGFEYATTAKENLAYTENAIVGTLDEPYALDFNVANGIGESEMSNVSVYPNPAQCGKEIMLSSTCDMVEIFNSIGIKVAEYQNVDRLKPIDVAGSYIIRMTNGDAVTYGKVIVR